MIADGTLALSRATPFFASAMLTAACASSGPSPSFETDVPQDDGASSRSNDASSESPATGSSAPVTDGAAPNLLTLGEASPTMPMGACKPGTYAGTFTTTVTIPDGGLLSLLFTINWSGTLSITLQGKVDTTQAGEFSTTTLVIAPGAQLSGSDQYGGVFAGSISGQLDCPSRAFTGRIDNGTYANSALVLYGDGGTVTMTGSLTGMYDPSTTPPALRNGTINAASPQVVGLEANGSWSATLQ
jgi:hypothetical protein